MNSIQTFLSLVLFTSRVQKQVRSVTLGNVVNNALCKQQVMHYVNNILTLFRCTVGSTTLECLPQLQYETLAAVTEVSTLHKVPLDQWIAQGVTFKFVGNNVDKKKGV